MSICSNEGEVIALNDIEDSIELENIMIAFKFSPSENWRISIGCLLEVKKAPIVAEALGPWTKCLSNNGSFFDLQ